MLKLENKQTRIDLNDAGHRLRRKWEEMEQNEGMVRCEGFSVVKKEEKRIKEKLRIVVVVESVGEGNWNNDRNKIPRIKVVGV